MLRRTFLKLLPAGIATIALPSVVKAETSLFDLVGKCEDNYIVDGIYMIQRQSLGVDEVTIMGTDVDGNWRPLYQSYLSLTNPVTTEFNGMRWTFNGYYTHVHLPNESRSFNHWVPGNESTLFSVRDGSFVDLGTVEVNDGKG